jgi:hypothetical protein
LIFVNASGMEGGELQLRDVVHRQRSESIEGIA